MAELRVALGKVGDRSIAATVYGLVDRGMHLRPALAAEMVGSVRMTFAEGYAPVLVRFGGGEIVVADDHSAGVVDLEVQAALPDFVLCVAAPLAGGLPRPTNRAGRAALARIADGRVDFIGSLKLARRLRRLMSVA